MGAGDAGWVACRVCGYPNRPRSPGGHNACTRCYRDLETGRFNPHFGLGQFAVVAVMYFFCALLGMLGGMLGGAGLMAIFDVRSGSSTGQAILFVAKPVGVALGLWLANRLRRRGGFARRPASPLEMPPGTSPRKRMDDQVGHVVAGMLFMGLGFGFSLEAILKGVREEVVGLLVGAVYIVGILGGWAYNLYTRSRP